eukprot:335504_1
MMIMLTLLIHILYIHRVKCNGTANYNGFILTENNVYSNISMHLRSNLLQNNEKLICISSDLLFNFECIHIPFYSLHSDVINYKLYTLNQIEDNNMNILCCDLRNEMVQNINGWTTNTLFIVHSGGYVSMDFNNTSMTQISYQKTHDILGTHTKNFLSILNTYKGFLQTLRSKFQYIYSLPFKKEFFTPVRKLLTNENEWHTSNSPSVPSLLPPYPYLGEKHSENEQPATTTLFNPRNIIHMLMSLLAFKTNTNLIMMITILSAVDAATWGPQPKSQYVWNIPPTYWGPQPLISDDGRCVGYDTWKDLYLHTCDDGNDQKWTMNYADGSIKNQDDGQCIQRRGAYGIFPTLYACDPISEQTWFVNANGQITNGDKCLVYGKANPTHRLTVETCESQYVWNIPPTYWGPQPLISDDGRCVGIDQYNDLYLHTCNGENDQKWTINYADGLIKNNDVTGECLLNDGNKWPKLKTCDGTSEQTWLVSANGQIKNGDKCLVYGNISPENRLTVETC